MEETLLRKFLPSNSRDDEESDEFRMYEFKVRICNRSRSHDWSDCPFAHPGEKARRRDPRRFHYSGKVCTDFRRGGCFRGDACEFAHGVFECWLHPARYRTQACKDGKNCKRKVCFFAHTTRQLRVLSSNSQSLPLELSSSSNRCCVFCHSVASSPTSTLMGFSHLSPSLSPSLSGYNKKQFFNGVLSYRDALTEIKNSMEGMDLSAASPTSVNSRNLSWVGVSSNCGDQEQFILSPSIPQAFGSRDFLERDEKINNNGWSCPDLEWVNELVM